MLLIFKVVYYQRSFFFLQQTETINEIRERSISKNNRLWVHSSTVLHIYNITPTPKEEFRGKGKRGKILRTRAPGSLLRACVF